jgi:catalase
MKATLKGRLVGILIADGSNGAEVAAVQKAVEKDGGKCKIVAPRVGGAKMADGKMLKADGQLAGTPSQIFDAVAIVLSDEGCQALLREGRLCNSSWMLLVTLKASEQARMRCRCWKKRA